MKNNYSQLFLFILINIFTDLVRLEELEDIKIDAKPFDISKDPFFLAGVNKKPFEGPESHVVSIGGMARLSCASTDEKLARLHRSRRESIINRRSWAILWVHKHWNNVIDPWLSDGRRSYDSLKVSPTWITDSYVSISSAGLTIVDIDPGDNGFYACVLVWYSIEEQISPLNLDKVEIISIHVLKVKSGLSVAPTCNQNEENSGVDCETGYEPWTFNVYYPVGEQSGDLLFQAPCYADIFLTALVLSGVDATFWSIGWKFIPYEEEDDEDIVEMDSPKIINWTKPIHICDSDPPVPCTWSNEIDTLIEVTRNLQAAQLKAAKFWRARWLLLSGIKPQSSGKWQCWIEGLAITNHPKKTSFRLRWLSNEIHVKMIRDKNVYKWWTTSEFWRRLGLILSPIIVILSCSIFATGWIATHIYSDRIPTIQQTYKKDSLPTNDFKSQTIEPNVYMNEFLRKSGIQSYHDLLRQRMSKSQTH